MGGDYKKLAIGQYQLPFGWEVKKISDVASINELSITKKTAPEEIEYIDIASVYKGRLISLQKLPFEKAPSRARRIVRGGDTIISTVRPNLEHYLFIKEAGPNTIASTGFAVITAKSVEPRFLYYCLTSKSFTDYLTRIAEGHTSAYPSFNPDVIENAEILIPPLPEQRAIARILGTLDDKIELNRRMNETLEALAQALFKSWFVDFDPVMVNALRAGNSIPEKFAERAAHYRENPDALRLPEDILQLFPNRFTDSELGPIPEGWEIGPLKQIASLIIKTIQPKDSPFKLWLHYSIPSYDDGKIPIIEQGRNIKSGKYSVPKYSVLVSKLNPQFPRVWLPIQDGAENAVCSTEFMPFVPRDPNERGFLYIFFLSDMMQKEISNRVTGSTGSRQRVRPKDIESMDVIIANKRLRLIYSYHMGRLLRASLEKQSESATLASLRDTLLPKLISGELRVPDVEKILEDAV